jgi:hypothetical protein
MKVLIDWLPLAIIVGIAIFLMRKYGKTSNKKYTLDDYKKTRQRYITG